jgi:hypothetical protein
MTTPSVRVAARRRPPRSRGGEEEFAVTLTFQWQNGHTMTFVANDSASASTLRNTILPALNTAFVVGVRGLPHSAQEARTSSGEVVVR